jgi:pimeloyl-ACP methyl ester carboxylesterase
MPTSSRTARRADHAPPAPVKPKSADAGRLRHRRPAADTRLVAEQAGPLPVDRTAHIATAPDGRTVCFAEWGHPEGRVVLSLHGTPGCRLLNSWRVEYGLDEALRSWGVRLITYDRPGYGRSDRLPGRSVMDCVQDVALIADAAGVDRFAIEGGSSGAHHALAVVALLPTRVRRLACVAPMAPYDRLGHEEWSRGQGSNVREYVAVCLEGEARMLVEFAREDADMREASAADDPRHAEVFEQTRAGLWGWIDDELAAFKPWGFDPADVAAPIEIWHDPQDPVLPPQHAAWLARAVPAATVVTTDALGHGSAGDPKPAWARLYSWLTEA